MMSAASITERALVRSYKEISIMVRQKRTQGTSGVRILAIGAAIVAGIVALGLLYVYISGGSGQASQLISAPELAPEVAGSIVTYDIVPAESQVSFTLAEDLRGERVSVVGTTDQVAGQVRVNFETPAASEIGVIRINVRTLETDNDFRNRAIRGQILLSSQDEFEFAEFTPTALTGLPTTLTMGEPLVFEIAGNLTLKGITQPVTFAATVTPLSRDRIEGEATTTIQRALYELTIPRVPGVANVTEDVTLAIRFAATASPAA